MAHTYQMGTMLEGGDYDDRTRQNVYDSDGTVVLTAGQYSAGTMVAVEACQAAGRPHVVINIALMSRAESVELLLGWVMQNGVGVLNVAGPRESGWPGAQAFSRELVSRLLA